jgi:hypothetical protein
MPKKQKRDSAYYEERLIRDHPGIYADLVGGKYQTVTEAALAAGLKRPRTRLHEMKNSWLKASAHEQDEFEKWLFTQPRLKAPHRSLAGASLPIATGLRLELWAKLRIQAVMVARKMTMGDVMAEMGLKRLNASVGNALRSENRLQPNVIAALEIWLDKNKYV